MTHVKDKGPALYAIVKGIIARSHERRDGECTAVFTKKDGSIRELVFSPALADNYHMDMSDKGFSRKANNPNLVNLVDLPLYQRNLDDGDNNQQAIRNAFKTMNMDTLISLVTFEGEWTFGEEPDEEENEEVVQE